MAGELTTGQIPNAIDRRVRKHFRDEYPKVDPQIEKIFVIETQEDANEYEQDYAGLGKYEVTAEGETFKLDAPGEGYSTVYIPVKKTKRVPYTYEASKWDKAALTTAANTGKELAAAAADTVEDDAASILRNAFSTSYTSYGDSKPLCSTDHTYPDSSAAQSNASANGLAMSPEGIEIAVTAMRGQKNKRGRLIKVRPTALIVPPALEAEAVRITKSTLKAGTGDNDTNPLRLKEYSGGMLADKVIVWDYLAASEGGSDTAWFLQDRNLAKLMWKWAEKPSVERDETTGKQNDVTYYLGKFYASKGWSDFVGIWGSKGDGAAYSS